MDAVKTLFDIRLYRLIALHGLVVQHYKGLALRYITAIPVITTLFLILLLSPMARGETITVGQDGGTSFTTIQEGINAAVDGDTVIVMPGVYMERIQLMRNIVFRKSLRDFRETYPDSEETLKTWYKVVMKAEWKTSNAVKIQYKNASIVGKNGIVFNICGTSIV